jgi:hypothetical protein
MKAWIWVPATAAGLALIVIAQTTVVGKAGQVAQATRVQASLTIPAEVPASQVEYMSGGSDPAAAARWSSCTPITWSVDTINIAASGVRPGKEIARWQQAVDVIATASGYQFEYVPVAPGSGSHFIARTSENSRTNIVISYESATDANGYQLVSLGNSQTIAMTALSWFDAGIGPKLSTNAEIDMDFADLLRATRAHKYSPEDRVSLMIHELGHAVGMGHIPDPNAMMYPVWIPGKTQMTPADAAGIGSLQQQPCPS